MTGKRKLLQKLFQMVVIVSLTTLSMYTMLHGIFWHF